MTRNACWRRRFLGIALSVLFFALSGCMKGATSQNAVAQDILSQKVTPQGKIPITILVKYAFSINAFEKAAEKKFSNLDIIQVGNFTQNSGIAEYQRRMEHDDLADVIMTWPLHIGEEYWDDRLLDLSGMSFTNQYNTSMLNTISKEGKLYYLPGPAQVRGIVYNKTLFEEKGWQVPRDFNGFISLCKEIEQSGIRSLQLGFKNPEVLDTALVGFSYSNCFSTPEDSQWIADYNNGQGSLGDQFTPAFQTFQKMIDAGIWKKSDLDIRYPQREQMLLSRQCAMIEDSSLMARLAHERSANKDEFALMPFFNPGSPSDWARLYMVCYIGLNKHLAEEQNKDKYDLAMQLMDYISTPEGQKALSGDTGAMYSSVKGVPPPNVPEIADLVSTLEAGRLAIFPESKNVQAVLRKGLAGILEGTMTSEDVIKMVDDENKNSTSQNADAVLGEASADFSLIETGNYFTDAMRDKTGAEIALFLDNGKDGIDNGKGIAAKFYQGPLLESDVGRVFPILSHGEKGTLLVLKMTGADLLKTLEYSITVANKSGWFYYFSGLRMEFSPTAQPGRRIRKVTDNKGAEIDASKVYTVAVMDSIVTEEFVQSSEETGIQILDLIKDSIREAGTISPSNDGRFFVVNP